MTTRAAHAAAYDAAHAADAAAYDAAPDAAHAAAYAAAYDAARAAYAAARAASDASHAAPPTTPPTPPTPPPTPVCSPPTPPTPPAPPPTPRYMPPRPPYVLDQSPRATSTSYQSQSQQSTKQSRRTDMKLYKLTDKDGKSYNSTQWGEGVTHETSGEGEMCGAGWLHAYREQLLAMFLDSIHGNFGELALLCEAEGEVEKDDGLKVGTRKLTVIYKPVVTREQRVKFAVLCARAVRHLWGECPEWDAWAETIVPTTTTQPEACK